MGLKGLRMREVFVLEREAAAMYVVCDSQYVVNENVAHDVLAKAGHHLMDVLVMLEGDGGFSDSGVSQSLDTQIFDVTVLTQADSFDDAAAIAHRALGRAISEVSAELGLTFELLSRNEQAAKLGFAPAI